MANTIAVSVIGDVRDINKKLGQVDSKLGNFGKKVSGFGTALAGAFAGGAAIQGIKSIIDSGSNLNETISKTNQIFGQGGPAMQAWASNAATSFGMSSQKALEGASSFGNFFDQIGLGKAAAMDMSKGLVQMSSDLGSFNNADPAQVMDAFQSATRGEYDALQRFIPTISAATVQAEAMRLSHKKNASALTEADKAQALYSLSQKGMGKAQGDFARTSEGAANQQRILNAKLEDAKAALGEKLLPAFTKVTGFIVDSVIPAFESFGGWLQKNSGWVTPIAVGIGAIVAAIGAWVAISRVFAAVQALVNIVLAANPIGIVILAIVGLVAALVYAWKHSETFRRVVTTAWNAVKAATTTVFNAVKTFILGVWEKIKAVGAIAVQIKDKVVGAWNTAKAKTAEAWNAVKAKVKEVWDGIKRGVTEGISKVVTTVSGLKGKVTGVLSKAKDWLVQTGKNVVQGMINGISSMGRTLINAIVGLIPGPIKNVVKKALGIASPSKVFKGYGKNIVEGLIIGMADMNGKLVSASSSLAKGVADGFSAPELALNTVGGTGSLGGNTYQITVEAPVGASSADIGRTIVKHIDAYERLGGRRAAA